jgi:hypothetical protein
MRNFSSISRANVSTYTINGGEYNSDVDLNAIVVELGRALEMTRDQVSHHMNSVAKNDVCPEWAIPSEYEVFQKLYEFYSFVCQSIETNGWDTQSSVFTYFNLNTGKSFVWQHTVC